MKTLREDIKTVLDYIFDEVGFDAGDFSDTQTDEILKLFEKRIDSWSEWAKPKEGKIPEELDPKYYKAFNDGFNEALRLVKNIDLKKEEIKK